jgi:murein DD-endopeptidase MepM/ murein hydrolase activator NlpD
MNLPFIEPKNNNNISQYFGENGNIYSRFGLRGHNGLDFAVPKGTKILAMVDGYVWRTGKDKDGYGIYVGTFTDLGNRKMDIVYAHMEKANVVLNQKFKAGDVLGFVDSTGFSTGNHLHLGIRFWQNNAIVNYNNGFLGYLDPYPLLNDKISWTNYWNWKKITGGTIAEYEQVPIGNKYNQNISDYEMMKILPWASWVWIFNEIKRFPSYNELIALTCGRWDFNAVFKGRVGDWFKYYTKSEYDERIKNGGGL